MHELNSRQTPFYHSLSLNPEKNTTSVNKNGFLIYVYKKFVNNICIIVILILTKIPMLLTIHYAISILSQVLHEGKTTYKFDVETCVKQGCIMSPLLFLLAIYWTIRTHTENGLQWTLWDQTDDLDFVDDMSLPLLNQNQMQGNQ